VFEGAADYFYGPVTVAMIVVLAYVAAGLAPASSVESFTKTHGGGRTTSYHFRPELPPRSKNL
jgi:hypothetical protein